MLPTTPRIARDEKGNEIDIVHRCKECPFAVMRTYEIGWLCKKTRKRIPINRISDDCPLDKVTTDEAS